MESFLEKELTKASCMVHHSGFIPFNRSMACSATADFSICCLRQASLCSLRRVSSRRLVSPMYDLPHEQGIWYTTPDWRSTGSGSFTLVKMEQRDWPDLKATLMLNLRQTRLMSSLTPEMYGMQTVALGCWASSAC